VAICSINVVIVTMKEPQNCSCHDSPIMLPVSCLFGSSFGLVVDASVPQLNLSMNHRLVKP
jgi:hypothetical protein